MLFCFIVFHENKFIAIKTVFSNIPLAFSPIQIIEILETKF